MWKDADKPDQSQTLLIDIPDVAASNITEQEKKDLYAMPTITKKEIRQMNSYFKPYIFYHKTGKNETECFCTACNRSYTADSTLYHKTMEICPHCHTTATAAAAGYSQKDKTETINFVIFKKHRTKDIVYAICINAGKRYNGDYRNWFNKVRIYGVDFYRQPDLECDLHKIYVFKPGECNVYRRQYAYLNGKYSYKYTKIKKKVSNPFTATMYKPTDTVMLNREVLFKTHLRYYAAALPVSMGNHLVEWLNLCSLYPIAEIAAKSESKTIQRIVQDKLCYDMSHRDLVNWKAKKPKDFLKITLNELRDFEQSAKVVYSLQTLEVYARHKKKGEKLSFDLCQFECHLKNLSSQYKPLLNYVEMKELYEYRRRQQKNGTWKHDYTYFDYLNHAQMCDYDLTQKNILYPRDIQQAHDDAVANWQIVQAEKEKEKAEAEAKKYGYPERYKKLCKKFAFEHGELMIVVPKAASEIITEGKVLQHCVGGYANRHIQGKTTILFLRHISEPDKPYYTIEVNEKEKYIVQCHGFRNEWKSKKAEEVKAFEKEFAKFIKNPKKYKAERKSEEQCRKSA